MSVRVMAMVWDSECLSPTEKLILLSLADHANDEGICYPSVARLAKKTGLSERAVRGCVKRLSDAGWLTVSRNAGPRGCNVFTITEPLQELHPAGAAPLHEVPQGVQEIPFTPAGDAPEPSKNHQGTIRGSSAQDHLSEERSEPRQNTVPEILKAALSDRMAHGFIDHRKALKRPLTEFAADRIIKQLDGLTQAQADEVVGRSIENGWAGIFPKSEDKHTQVSSSKGQYMDPTVARVMRQKAEEQAERETRARAGQ